MDPDAALESIGSPWKSRWTMGTLLLICIMRGFGSSWQFTSVVFLGHEPEHHCRLPEGVALNQSVPLVEDSAGLITYDKCHVYVNYTASSNQTESCTNGWEYDMSTHNMVHEWNLVCGKDYYADLWQSAFVVGTMIGSIFQGNIIDKLGRKTTFLVNIFILYVITFVAAWVRNFYIFIAIRLACGILVQGSNVAGLVLACEMFQSKQRSIACMAINCAWGIGMMVFAVMAFYLPEWRHLTVAMSVPILFAIPGYFIIQESLPWLLANNRKKKVDAILRKISRWNGHKLPEPTDDKNLLPSPEVVLVENGTGPNGLQSPVAFPLSKKLYSDLLQETLLREASQSLPDLAPPVKAGPATHEPHDTLSSMPMLNGGISNSSSVAAKPVPIVADVTASMDSFYVSSLNIHHESQIVINREGILSVQSISRQAESDGDDGVCASSQVWALLKSSRYRMYMCIAAYCLFSISLGYHGLSLATGTLAGNIYVNYALMGLVEVPAYIMVALMSKCWGRKTLICCCYVTGGLLLWLTLIVFHIADPAIVGTANTVLAMTGKFFLSMGFGILPQYSIELFPTTVRSQALGVVYFVGRMGSVIAPFSVYVGKLVIWLPALILGSVTISGGLLVLFLPETREQPLLQTIEEAEEYCSKREKKGVKEMRTRRDTEVL